MLQNQCRPNGDVCHNIREIYWFFSKSLNHYVYAAESIIHQTKLNIGGKGGLMFQRRIKKHRQKIVNLKSYVPTFPLVTMTNAEPVSKVISFALILF